MRKLVFIAHEFGLFPGHGGIASYLDILVNTILDRTDDIQIYIFALVYDKKNRALKDKRVQAALIQGNTTHEQGKYLLKKLCRISPDYVECADYLALCLESLVYKHQSDRNELSNTMFVTLHHTASRECFEWNNKVPIEFADPFIKECFARERTQMRLSDLNVSPSTFLGKYVEKNYSLDHVHVINTPCMVNIVDRSKQIKALEEQFDLSMYRGKFVVACISRVEGRKNQRYLVQQFSKFLERTGADAILLVIGNSSVNSVTNVDFRQEAFHEIPSKFKDRIFFFDFMNTKEKQNIFALSDLSVLASTYENYPIALIESVCNGVPVLCSKYCGFSDCMGESRENMTFDPFEPDALVRSLEYYYNLSAKERENVTNQQLYAIQDVGSPENTVDYRLETYQKYQQIEKPKKHPALLVVDEKSFLDVIDQDMVSHNYEGIIVHYYFDKTLANSLEKWFAAMFDDFQSGDIVCYGGDIVLQTYHDVLVHWRPFLLKGNFINESSIGKCIADVIAENSDNKQLVYNIVDDNDGLIDHARGIVPYAICEKRRILMDYLTTEAFCKENSLKLEEKFR